MDWPTIVIGTTPLGNCFRALSDEQKRQLVAAWLAALEPPWLFDTAGKYGAGMALEALSRALTELGVDPADIIVSDKLGWRRMPMKASGVSFEPDVWIDLDFDAVQDIGRDGILRSLDEDRRLLGAFTPRLLSVHDPDDFLAAAGDAHEREQRWAAILAAYEQLSRLRSEGVEIGVGCKSWRVAEAIYDRVPLDWLMIANSYTLLAAEEPLVRFLDRLHSDGVAVVNAAVMHGGFLAGGDTFDYRRLDRTRESDRSLWRRRERLGEFCRAAGVDPVHAAIQFGLSHPAIRAIALSAVEPVQVAPLVAAVRSPLSPPWLEELRQFCGE